MQPRTHLSIALALLLCPACAPEDDLEFRDTSTGGIVFNTHELENERFSELQHPTNIGIERAVEFVTLPGGVVAPEFVVKGGAITLLDGQNNAYQGDALLDSDWWLTGHKDGAEKAMRLAAHAIRGGTPQYLFTHDTSNGPVDNCPPPPENPFDGGWARLLTDFTLYEPTGVITAKPGNTYVACSTGATGKAAQWGYYDRAVAAKDFKILEAAIRVVRADYCYNGQSHTEVGVGLWLVDRWGGFQKHTDADDNKREIEGVWSRKGMLCRGATTRLGEEMPQCAGQAVPLCKPGVTLDQYKDGLFMTYLP